MLDEWKTAKKVAGVKQLTKAIRRGEIRAVLLAKNADPYLTEPVERLAGDNGIPVHWVRSMQELGAFCGIAVGAAAAGIKK